MRVLCLLVFPLVSSATPPRPITFRLKTELKTDSSESVPRAVSPSANDPKTSLLNLAKIEPLVHDSPPVPVVGQTRPATRSKLDKIRETDALKRHRLDLYYKIWPSEFGERTPEEIIKELQENPLVDFAGQEPPIVDPDLPLGRSNVPDYTDCTANTNCQRYMLGPVASGVFRLGGLNVLEAHKLTNNTGGLARILQTEHYGHWDWDHIDLPKPWLVATDKVVDDHATNSAGLMWGLDNGFGVKGIAATSKAGYTIWEVENMLDLGNLLEAGDVIQVGVQYLVKDYFPDLCAEARYPGTGADLQYHKDTCYLPVEYWPATADAIKYLVQEKGIHFVMAAGNGNMNIDHSKLSGMFARSKDSGAIYCGAADPADGKKARFSNYGERVDLFTWGFNVTTTGPSNSFYHEYGGTSSANPLISGCAAFIQSVAREKGIGNLAPKVLRQLLYDSGQPVPYPEQGKNIGRQPDLVKAVKLLEEMSPGITTTPATTGASTNYVTTAPTTALDNWATTTLDNWATTALNNWATTAPDNWATTAPDNWATTAPDNWGTTTPDNWGTTTPDNWGTTTAVHESGPYTSSGGGSNEANSSDTKKTFIIIGTSCGGVALGAAAWMAYKAYRSRNAQAYEDYFEEDRRLVDED